MPSLNSLLSTIKEGKAARVTLSLQGVTEQERLSCFFGIAKPPAFTLVFPHGTLAVDQVDTSKPCMVMVDYIDQTVSISADINGISDPRTLELVARNTTSHTQLRNYFRVDAAARVAASSVIPESMAREGESWKLLGDTIDLSGSGLLCSFSHPVELDKKVRIELTLPTSTMDMITAIGHVVRCTEINKETYHVGLHFDAIDSESQDKIMACCFAIQRQHLRMRVEVQNETEVNSASS